MKINIVGDRYYKLEDAPWFSAFSHIVNSCQDLGHKVTVDSSIQIPGSAFPFVRGQHPDPDISIYNHSHIYALNNPVAGSPLFWKPTGPSSKYFTIDPIGYACHSSISYDKPDFERTETDSFFETEVQTLIQQKSNKWTGLDWYEKDCEKIAFTPIPRDHILVLGQMPGDETVTKFSFGNHWTKLVSIVEYLIEHTSETIVVKLHPYLKERSSKENWDTTYYRNILTWQKNGVTVVYDFTSIHDILPKTKVAILENSTAGVECLLYDVPLISYGYPEYHWITYKLDHLMRLNHALSTVETWWSQNLSRAWVTWYCTKYACSNYETTLNRLRELL